MTGVCYFSILLIMNSYTYICSNYFDPLDEIMNWDDIEGVVSEVIDAK